MPFGLRFWYYTSITPLKDERGNKTTYVVFLLRKKSGGEKERGREGRNWGGMEGDGGREEKRVGLEGAGINATINWGSKICFII